MFAVVLFGLTLITAQAGKAVGLPDTPQGRHLQAYIGAFNTGDEAKYLAMMEQHVAPELLKKRPAAERAKLFQRMKADFGTLKVSRVLKASATQIDLAVPNREGIEATFSFEFDRAAPFRISRLGVEIDRGPGGNQPAGNTAAP